MTSSPRAPVKQAAEPPQLRRVLEYACKERGLSATGAKLIHHYSNAVYLLPEEHVVARLTHEGSIRLVRLMQTIVSWLTKHTAVAATAPMPGTDAVAVDDKTIVSFWTYYPQPNDGPGFTSAHLACILRDLHDAEDPPLDVERWQPLTSLAMVLDDPTYAGVLSPSDLAWLGDVVADVKDRVQALDSPLGHGLIHGDAWAGNLLWDAASGPVQQWSAIGTGSPSAHERLTSCRHGMPCDATAKALPGPTLSPGSTAMTSPMDRFRDPVAHARPDADHRAAGHENKTV